MENIQDAKTKEEIRKEKKRLYQREDMKNRLATDPEFLAKQRALKRENRRKKYAEDEEFKQKVNEQSKNRYATYRNAFLEMTKNAEE